MPKERMLPQQQVHPPDVQPADAPHNAQVFGITRLGFTSFDELIQRSAQDYGVEYEILFSNSLGTQHGYMKVVNGKVVKTIPLIEFSVLSSVAVIRDGAKLGYIVKHYICTKDNMLEEFISITIIEKTNSIVISSFLLKRTSVRTIYASDWFRRLLLRNLLTKSLSWWAQSKAGNLYQLISAVGNREADILLF